MLRRLGISLTSLNRPFSKLICTGNTLLVWAVYRHFAKLVFYSILGHGYSQTFYVIDEKAEGQRAWSSHPHPRERPQLLNTSLPSLLLSFPLLLSLRLPAPLVGSHPCLSLDRSSLDVTPSGQPPPTPQDWDSFLVPLKHAVTHITSYQSY